MKNLIIFLSFACIFCFFLAKGVSAKVVINEVLANPVAPEDGSEWVELYNLEDSPVSLSGCVLYLDSTTLSQKITFGDEDFIDRFRVVSWDGTKLRNDGDLVKLDCGVEIDQVAYGDEPGAVVPAQDDGVSFGRSPDGIGNFYILSSLTVNEPNSTPISPTPTPTSTPTPSPKPTPTLTPTPTPKATSTPTPKPTSSPVPTSKSEGELEDNEENISQEEKAFTLGVQDTSLNKTTSNPEVQGVQDEERRNFPFLAVIFSLLGIGLITIALLPIIKNRMQRL